MRESGGLSEGGVCVNGGGVRVFICPKPSRWVEAIKNLELF